MSRFDRVAQLDEGAAVQETTQENGVENTSTKTPTATKSKLLKALPVKLENRQKELRRKGVTTLNLSQYIIEALREKLEKDEQN